MSVYICGAHILIIVNHAPPPQSYFSLLSIVNRRSFPHPPEVGARYSLYVQMYTLGCCVEKNRCHSCGAHGNGKTLLAQVLPCGMTKVFVKLRSLPETSIFNAASIKRVYISQRRIDKKLPSCMFSLTTSSSGASRVTLQKLDAWDYRARFRGSQWRWLRATRFGSAVRGITTAPTSQLRPTSRQLLRRVNAFSRMVRSKRKASHKIFSATSDWERHLELGGSALNSAAWATRLTAVINVPRGHGLQTVSVEHLSYRLGIHPKIVLVPTHGGVAVPEGAHGRGNSLH